MNGTLGAAFGEVWALTNLGLVLVAVFAWYLVPWLHWYLVAWPLLPELSRFPSVKSRKAAFYRAASDVWRARKNAAVAVWILTLLTVLLAAAAFGVAVILPAYIDRIIPSLGGVDRAGWRMVLSWTVAIYFYWVATVMLWRKRIREELRHDLSARTDA